MIRIWDTDIGAEIVSYPPFDDGCRRLALSMDGKLIASASANGTIRLWRPEVSPWNTDISFKVQSNAVRDLSSGPDGSKMLVCLEEEVQIWNISLRQELFSLHVSGIAAFSFDGKFIIVGDDTRTTIWDETSRRLQSSSQSDAQSMSSSEAKNLIRSCGPLAHRLWVPVRDPGVHLCQNSQSTIFSTSCRTIYRVVQCLVEMCLHQKTGGN